MEWGVEGEMQTEGFAERKRQRARHTKIVLVLHFLPKIFPSVFAHYQSLGARKVGYRLQEFSVKNNSRTKKAKPFMWYLFMDTNRSLSTSFASIIHRKRKLFI